MKIQKVNELPGIYCIVELNEGCALCCLMHRRTGHHSVIWTGIRVEDVGTLAVFSLLTLSFYISAKFMFNVRICQGMVYFLKLFI